VTEGFDTGAHLDVLRAISWTNPGVDLHQMFYAYHPPLAFLLAHTFTLLGLPDVASVQIVSFLSMLVVCLSLRALLRLFHLLDEPGPVLFLYATLSLPVVVFLGKSINIDVVIFALACLTLLFLASLWKSWDAGGHHRWLGWQVPVVGVLLLLALFTKFSGILLLALPAGTAWVLCKKWRTRAILLGILCAAAAGIMALPYYYARYEVPEHTFFPSNGDQWDRDNQGKARLDRDAHPVEFILSLFMGTSAHANGVEHRDLNTPRFLDTWKDLWMRDLWLGEASEWSLSISNWYLLVMPVLLFLGTMVTLQRWWRGLWWDRMGAVFLLIGVFHMFFLILFAWRNPWGGGVPTKMIYITPALPVVGYLLSQCAYLFDDLLTRWRRWSPLLQRFLLALVTVFLLINHLLPVY
jgi:hypothetical protein